MIALLAVAASALPSSHADAERAYGAWVTACDTGLRCEVSSAMGDPANMEVRISVLREAGPDAEARIRFSSAGRSHGGPRSVVIDGHGYGIVERAGSEWGVLPGTDRTVAMALAKGRRIEVVSGAERFTINAGGAAAALRDMDARQGRAGTVTAIVARGARPASAVPEPPPLPIRFESRRPRQGPTLQPSPQRLAAWRRAAECDPNLDQAVHPPQSWVVDRHLAVILVACWAGGHNSHHLVKVGRRADGADARDAMFDFQASIGERDGPTASPHNPARDEETGRLVSGQHGGLAYPSTFEEWVWDGRRFRIVQGWTSHGSTFRARVKQR